MIDNMIKYSFKYEHADGQSVIVEHLTYDVTYREVVENFFKFLSTAYGYEITAKDVIDADIGNPGLSD